MGCCLGSLQGSELGIRLGKCCFGCGVKESDGGHGGDDGLRICRMCRRERNGVWY